jgi:dipeptidyl aminopeptidase/acylaminoacyl peptidase
VVTDVLKTRLGIGTPTLPVVLAFLLAQVVAAQPHVWIEGDVFYEAKEGYEYRAKRLTEGKRVSEFRISPDGKFVALIETVDGPMLQTPLEDVEPEEIWIQQLDSGTRRLLAKAPLSTYDASFFGLRFAPEGTRLYFHSVCAVVTSCVNSVDLSTGTVGRLTAGQILDLVNEGPYRGHLVVSQHRYYGQGGSFEEAVLLSADGKEVFDIGSSEDPELLAAFADAVRRPMNADGSHPAQSVLRPTSPGPPLMSDPTVTSDDVRRE